MRAPSLVLGVDGGASKTVALIADRTGRVLGAGRSGNADIYRTPDAVAEVGRAIAGALSSAGVLAGDIAAAALSLVGADWPEDFAYWQAAAPELGLSHLQQARFLIVNDAIGALAAGVAEGPAIAIVCGTGTAVGSRAADGAIWHSSFWQRTQGAVEMARKALDAVICADLGIAPATALTGAALTYFGKASVAGVLHAMTGRLERPRSKGGFAAALLDVAEAGDPVAREIVITHAVALAAYGRVAASRVGIVGETGGTCSLMLAGGVFRHPSRLMKDQILADLRGPLPDLHLITDAVEPVAGAVVLALEAVGGRHDRPAHALIQSTMPHQDFFTTNAATGSFR